MFARSKYKANNKALTVKGQSHVYGHLILVIPIALKVYIYLFERNPTKIIIF